MKLNKVTTQLIDLIQKTKDFSLQNYVKDIDSKKLAKILRDLSLVYYNTGETLVSDEVFDYLKDHLEKIDPINDFLNEVGAPIDSKEKVKLPYPMGSLDKIKPSTQELDKWKIDFKGPYVISDKLDGISAQEPLELVDFCH